MQEEGPRCCAWQEGRLHLQLPLLLSAELWAETSCSHLCSSSPCCHSGDTCSRSVQIRQEHMVCFGRQAGRVRCAIPLDGEGIAEDVVWWRLLQGCRAWGGLSSGWAAKRSWTAHLLRTKHCTGGLGGWKPPLLPSPGGFLVQLGPAVLVLYCRLFAVAIRGCLKLLYSSKVENQASSKLENKSHCRKVELWSL